MLFVLVLCTKHTETVKLVFHYQTNASSLPKFRHSDSCIFFRFRSMLARIFSNARRISSMRRRESSISVITSSVPSFSACLHSFLYCLLRFLTLFAVFVEDLCTVIEVEVLGWKLTFATCTNASRCNRCNHGY